MLCCVWKSVFIAPDPHSHPSRDFQTWGSDPLRLCSCSSHGEATWQNAVGKEGVQSWHGSEEHLLSPPTRGASEHDPEQADPSLGRQCPKAQQDSEPKSKQGAARQKPPAQNQQSGGRPQPARQTQDCLKGGRKPTSCLWVSGKGQS